MASFTDNLIPDPFANLYSYGGGYRGGALPNFQRNSFGNLGVTTQDNDFSSNRVNLGNSSTEKSWLDGALGPNGWGGLALGGAQTLGNLFMGMQNYGLAKDSLNFQKDAFNKNYAAQQKTTNSALADRQSARLAANGGQGYMSVDDYMSKYGI